MTQNQKDNELLHLEWETKYCAYLVTAELNNAHSRKK